MVTEYRVSWEMGNGPTAATSGMWAPIERITDDEEDALDQYEVLKRWEQEGIEPIRDVRFQTREPGEWQDQIREPKRRLDNRPHA